MVNELTEQHNLSFHSISTNTPLASINTRFGALISGGRLLLEEEGGRSKRRSHYGGPVFQCFTGVVGQSNFSSHRRSLRAILMVEKLQPSSRYLDDNVC